MKLLTWVSNLANASQQSNQIGVVFHFIIRINLALAYVYFSIIELKRHALLISFYRFVKFFAGLMGSYKRAYLLELKRVKLHSPVHYDFTQVFHSVSLIWSLKWSMALQLKVPILALLHTFKHLRVHNVLCWLNLIGMSSQFSPQLLDLLGVVLTKLCLSIIVKVSEWLTVIIYLWMESLVPRLALLGQSAMLIRRSIVFLIMLLVTKHAPFFLVLSARLDDLLQKKH